MRGTDQTLLDLFALDAGKAMAEALGSPKAVALAGEVKERHARRWRNGDRSDPAFRVIEIMRKAADPWALVRLFLAAAVERELATRYGTLTEAKVRQLWADTCDEEQVVDGDEDVAVTRHMLGRADLATIYHHDAANVRVLLRRMAITLVCQRHDWDPRPAMVRA